MDFDEYGTVHGFHACLEVQSYGVAKETPPRQFVPHTYEKNAMLRWLCAEAMWRQEQAEAEVKRLTRERDDARAAGEVWRTAVLTGEVT
jgi:hypothetical protein